MNVHNGVFIMKLVKTTYRTGTCWKGNWTRSTPIMLTSNRHCLHSRVTWLIKDKNTFKEFSRIKKSRTLSNRTRNGSDNLQNSASLSTSSISPELNQPFLSRPTLMNLSTKVCSRMRNWAERTTSPNRLNFSSNWSI